MRHVNIKIFGKVQNVNFRYAAFIEASRLGLRGFVKNLPDGTVYAEVEGGDSSVESFVNWCRRGPKLAQVERVEVREGSVKNFSNFVIL